MTHEEPLERHMVIRNTTDGATFYATFKCEGDRVTEINKQTPDINARACVEPASLGCP